LLPASVHETRSADDPGTPDALARAQRTLVTLMSVKMLLRASKSTVRTDWSLGEGAAPSPPLLERPAASPTTSATRAARPHTREARALDVVVERGREGDFAPSSASSLAAVLAPVSAATRRTSWGAMPPSSLPARVSSEGESAIARLCDRVGRKCSRNCRLRKDQGPFFSHHPQRDGPHTARDPPIVHSVAQRGGPSGASSSPAHWRGARKGEHFTFPP
jgi:hypothetical protein